MILLMILSEILEDQEHDHDQEQEQTRSRENPLYVALLVIE
jgi:hypothetical protein